MCKLCALYHDNLGETKLAPLSPFNSLLVCPLTENGSTLKMLII